MPLARIAKTCLRTLERRRKAQQAPPPERSASIDWSTLLGRSPVAANEVLLDASIRNRSVLITGAGGSIGSALCRRILRQRPRRIVLVERSEYALYSVTKTLAARIASDSSIGQIDLVSCLADAGDRPRMNSIMRERQVDVVYHTAAFKHVPIVECNEIEGIRNNAFATWRTAMAAIEAGVSLFVLVSSDKAVRPAGVMGATKRLAEMVLQSLHADCRNRADTPRFATVRFGNVLGSSGSVVPLFQEQIASGGPVTVTHPQVSRYFMTIPEAAELLIQAGSMALPEQGGRGGEVFVLDMGEPIQIDQLAQYMITLSGRTPRTEETPHGDVEIVYTGLRPGEKLHEELFLGENLQPTGHPGILRCSEQSTPWSALEAHLHRLEAATDRHDVRDARAVLERIVPDYRPLGAPILSA